MLAFLLVARLILFLCVYLYLYLSTFLPFYLISIDTKRVGFHSFLRPSCCKSVVGAFSLIAKASSFASKTSHFDNLKLSAHSIRNFSNYSCYRVLLHTNIISYYIMSLNTISNRKSIGFFRFASLRHFGHV